MFVTQVVIDDEEDGGDGHDPGPFIMGQDRLVGCVLRPILIQPEMEIRQVMGVAERKLQERKKKESHDHFQPWGKSGHRWPKMVSRRSLFTGQIKT